jgi:hypothetical protein
MAYTDFSLEKAEKLLGLTTQPAELFTDLSPLPIPAWLREVLARGMALALVSEKARGEFIVGPILLATRELSHNVFAIYKVDAAEAAHRALTTYCHAILNAAEFLYVD